MLRRRRVSLALVISAVAFAYAAAGGVRPAAGGGDTETVAAELAALAQAGRSEARPMRLDAGPRPLVPRTATPWGLLPVGPESGPPPAAWSDDAGTCAGGAVLGRLAASGRSSRGPPVHA